MDNNKTHIAFRFNTGKLKWSLVDFGSLKSMVKVLEFGAVKNTKPPSFSNQNTCSLPTQENPMCNLLNPMPCLN